MLDICSNISNIEPRSNEYIIIRTWVTRDGNIFVIAKTVGKGKLMATFAAKRLFTLNHRSVVSRTGARCDLEGLQQRSRSAIACSLSFALAVVPTAGRTETLNVSAFTELARRCGPSVAPATLAAVAKTESNFRSLVVSDNTTSKARDFARLGDAVAVADALIAKGHSVDLGLMQINSANLHRLGYTSRDALDSCKSVSGGASILSRNYAGNRGVSDPQVALRHALSQYNTGNIRSGYRNGYVHRVEQAARSLLLAATVPGSTAMVLRVAAPLARPATQVSWNVWGSLEHSMTTRGDLAPQNVLVF